MKQYILSSIGCLLSVIQVSYSQNPYVDSIVKVDYEKPYQEWKKQQQSHSAKSQCPNCPLQITTEHVKKCMAGDINGALKLTAYKPGDHGAGLLKSDLIEDSKGNYGGASTKLQKGMSGYKLGENPVVVYCSETEAYVKGILSGKDKVCYLKKINGSWKLVETVPSCDVIKSSMFLKYSTMSDAKRKEEFQKLASSKMPVPLSQLGPKEYASQIKGNPTRFKVEKIEVPLSPDQHTGGYSLDVWRSGADIVRITCLVVMESSKKEYDCYFRDGALIYYAEKTQSYAWNEQTGMLDYTKANLDSNDLLTFKSGKMTEWMDKYMKFHPPGSEGFESMEKNAIEMSSMFLNEVQKK
jgi:hypothetical protein